MKAILQNASLIPRSVEGHLLQPPLPLCPHRSWITQTFPSRLPSLHPLCDSSSQAQQALPGNPDSKAGMPAAGLHCPLHYSKFCSQLCSRPSAVASLSASIPRGISLYWWDTLISSLLCTHSALFCSINTQKCILLEIPRGTTYQDPRFSYRQHIATTFS